MRLTCATVTRRLSTSAGFCKYAVEEELLDHSPAAHVRRPRLDYESHATALDRNELGALLVVAGLRPPLGHALISLLALNGLRVSEATGADIEHPFLAGDGRRLDRHGAGRIVRRSRTKPGSASLSARTRRGTRSSRPVFDAGVPLRDVQEAASHAEPRTTIRYDRARGSLDRHATYIVAAYVAGAAR
jgi:integrase